jgi:hypothetical protein
MDYGGTFYSAINTGYDGDKLTPAGAATTTPADFDINDLVGDYTGSVTGYEYCAVYGSYNTFTYDGETHSYVNIARGEGENDIVFTNLVPSGYSYIQSSAIPATAYAYSEYEGYKGYIEIDPQKIGTITYYGYDYDAWIGADWSDGAYCYGPTAAAYFYVTDDGDIEMNSTGWSPRSFPRLPRLTAQPSLVTTPVLSQVMSIALSMVATTPTLMMAQRTHT